MPKTHTKKIVAKKIAKQYALVLKKANYPFSAIYLFGSYAKGTPRKWSDIDIAIISNKLRGHKDDDRLALWQLRHEVDLRIEPHGFTVKEFANPVDPMVYEIKKTGIRIA